MSHNSYNQNQKDNYFNNDNSTPLEDTRDEYYSNDVQSKTPSKRFSNTPIQELNEAHRGNNGRNSVTQAVTLKRGSAVITSTSVTQPLINQHQREKSVEMSEQNDYGDFNQVSGQYDPYSDFNNIRRYDDPYYDEEATRNNNIYSPNGVLLDPNSYPLDNFGADYTDRDFPGGGKGARQSINGENLVLPPKRKSRCCCCSRKSCVIITFITCAILAVILFFVWPRIPIVTIDGDKTEVAKDRSPVFIYDPPSINMSINVPIKVDNRENWVPYKFKLIDVYDAASLEFYNRPVGNGNITNYSLQPRALSTVTMKIYFDYATDQSNDAVFQDFITACTTNSTNSNGKTLLNLRFDVKLFISGIDWIYKPAISIPISDLKCPYPSNS
ncbi:9507_t:CDS:2 [Diversispora eburnea]|uniref:9507_t:CDS:1 n=1 Tax=Diversispora eburnea TaxID=1213867 RepID=A0A9N8UYR9_9GLOM|nr:9507_t:CDS:2 [Diversispora eburnea]